MVISRTTDSPPTSPIGGLSHVRSTYRSPVGELSVGAGPMVDMERIDTNPRSGTNAVEVRGLVKHYGATKALDGVDLDVREGTVLGVLGPNGAGKTTLVRRLSTLITPDAGHAVVAGYDVVRQPRQLAPPDRPDRAVRLGRREALSAGRTST
ncbi:hypothetical protein SVIOM74S_05018 [Streptomyces violarus]